mmetsp:Transcript_845/g.2495  ORF Transcript_845/g.2495 Transcript_845/m.2495 type:complete len:129 (+) Transcript_845:177-563(+)
MPREDLDEETIDSVLEQLGPGCRAEVEAALDAPETALSVECKQDIQAALGGFTSDMDPGEVPPLPQEQGIVRHQQKIGLAMFAAGFLFVLARFLLRRRSGGDGAKKKKSSKGGKEGKAKAKPGKVKTK